MGFGGLGPFTPNTAEAAARLLPGTGREPVT